MIKLQIFTSRCEQKAYGIKIPMSIFVLFILYTTCQKPLLFAVSVVGNNYLEVLGVDCQYFRISGFKIETCYWEHTKETNYVI